MSDTVAGLLERAREAFERHAHEEVLQLLLEAWKKTHTERIALLAGRLTELASSTDAAHVGQLSVPRRFEALTKDAGPGDETSVARAVDELMGGPDDPRLAPALLRLATRPFVTEEPRLGRRIYNVLGGIKDPRTMMARGWCWPTTCSSWGTHRVSSSPCSAARARTRRVSKRNLRRLPPPGPFWRTVREVDWSWTGDETAADWLAHPHLSGVTVLWQVNPRMARRLGLSPPSLAVRKLKRSALAWLDVSRSDPDLS